MFLILKVCLILLLTPFSACDVRGSAVRQRHEVTSPGYQLSGFLTSSGSPHGGPGFLRSFVFVGEREARLSCRVSAVKAALQPRLFLFPQNGGSSAVFQNFPQSAQALKYLGVELISLSHGNKVQIFIG